MATRLPHLHRYPGLWSSQFVPAQNSAVEVDPQNALARGLLGFYLPGISGRDLVGRAPPLVPNAGQLGGVASGAGPAFGCAALGTPNGLATTQPMPLPTFTNGASLWFYRQVLTTPVSAPLPWMIALHDLGADFRVLAAYSDGGSSNLSGFANNNFINTFMSSGIPNDTQTVAMTFTPLAANSIIAYFKGVQVGSASGGSMSTIGYTATTNFFVGMGGNMNIIAAGVWSRPLLATEIQMLDREPFAMLRPAGRRRVFATPTAAVAPAYRARVVRWG